MADVVKVTIYVTNIKNNTKVWQAASSSPATSRPRPWSR
jgi:hypothetical protein